MSKRKPTPALGTLAAYKHALKALDAAREAVEATGIDPELIDAFGDAAHEEAMAMLACDVGDPAKPAATYLMQRTERQHKAVLAAIEREQKPRTVTVQVEHKPQPRRTIAVEVERVEQEPRTVTVQVERPVPKTNHGARAHHRIG